MGLMYSSTRNGDKKFTASQAILKGLADDGGLFVPESIPALDVTIDELAKMSYQETAYAVMKQFLTDFTEEELKNCINKAYDSKFDTEEIAPLVQAAGANAIAIRWSSYVSIGSNVGSHIAPSHISVSLFSSRNTYPSLRNSRLRASMRSVSFILRLASPVNLNGMLSNAHVTTTVCAKSGAEMKS